MVAEQMGKQGWEHPWLTMIPFWRLVGEQVAGVVELTGGT
jgi:hypothetical protein